MNKGSHQYRSFLNGKKHSNKIKMSTCCIGKPTPKDFDTFLPWICLELQVPYKVVVHRGALVESISNNQVHSNVRLSRTQKKSHDIIKQSLYSNLTAKLIKNSIDAIPLTALYDSKGHLREVAIVSSPYEIPRKIIIAITLCIPFHIFLEKLEIRKGKLNMAVIQEIGKLLPHSNITCLYLEECYVQDGGYHLLLEQISQLKHLALRRLGLNDDECKKIVHKLDIGNPSSKSLLSLDLTSNKLTDETAFAFAEVLRRNRRLLHLNLCDNNIKDVGAACILNSLMEFRLTEDEIINKKRRRLEFLIKRNAFFVQSKFDLMLQQDQKEDKENKHGFNTKRVTKNSTPDTLESPKKSSSKKVSSVSLSKLTISELAEKITKDTIGDFVDAFEDQNITFIGNQVKCNGNFSLCSINISYNNLTYLTIRKILEVLHYQRQYSATLPYSGLLRVVFEGNNLPCDCHDYDEIKGLLIRALADNLSVSNQSHSTLSIQLSRRATTPSKRSTGRRSIRISDS